MFNVIRQALRRDRWSRLFLAPFLELPLQLLGRSLPCESSCLSLPRTAACASPIPSREASSCARQWAVPQDLTASEFPGDGEGQSRHWLQGTQVGNFSTLGSGWLVPLQSMSGQPWYLVINCPTVSRVPQRQC